MKRFVLAIVAGLTAATNLQKVDKPSIWDESVQDNALDVCGSPWGRWKSNSNWFSTYKKYITSNNLVFRDWAFQTNWNSIYMSQTRGSRKQQYHRSIKGWKRIKDIYPNKGTPSILGKFNHLNPQGIRQGSLNDCWFLAGATALAENRHRMQRIIHVNSRRQYNPSGIYRYYFWNYKKWQAINVDDWLPVKHKYSNSDKYFKPFGTDVSLFGAWWMPLFEKAYAKLNGNYDRIEWGSGFESLRQLTGKPVYFFNHQKLKQTEGDLFNLFHKMAREDYPMVVSCCSSNGNAPDGLQGSHAYTLLDVVQIGGYKLAKIRNPWSSEGYNGKFSDKDQAFWTPAMQQAANHKLGNDGIFFMPFHQFIKPGYFRSTTVAIYKNFKQRTIYTLQQSQAVRSIKIFVPTGMYAYFTFEMENPRFSKNCKNFRQHAINTYFFKGDRFPGMNQLLGPIGYLRMNMYHSTQGKPDQWLPRGHYTIMLKNWAAMSGPLHYTLSVYQENANKIRISYH